MTDRQKQFLIRVLLEWNHTRCGHALWADFAEDDEESRMTQELVELLEKQ